VWRFIRPAPGSRVAVQIETLKPLRENSGWSNVAVSPDGRHLVYVVRDVLGDYLVHRRLDQFVATPIPDSGGAREPFFSPDSQWVGFWAKGNLKKASLRGGNPVDLCEACGVPDIWGATWSPAGDEIIFARARSLWRVPAKSGEATIVKQPEPGQSGYGRPEFLPDGRAVLVEIRSGSGPGSYAIGLLDLESLELHTLLRPGTDPAYAPSGHIIFARGDALYAVAFDARRRTVSGEPTLVLEGVSHRVGAAQFSFSREGLLAYVEWSTPSSRMDDRSLVWVDREGTPTPLTERRDAFFYPRLSPDGTRVAVAIVGRIWIYEIETETWQLLTSDGYANSPVWAPGGERVVFTAGWGPLWNYQPFSIPADFSGSAEQLLEHEFDVGPRSFSPSGQLIFVENHPAEQGNILMLPGDGGSPQYLVRTDSNEQTPMVSPNGRWLAYSSDRSGVPEVFVEPFPGGGGRVQVSASGGTEPQWAPGGHELFYRNGAQMIAVPVTTESEFAIAGERQILFESDAYMRATGASAYDVDRDGQRFLMVQMMEAGEEGQIQANQRLNLIFNWFEELKRLVPTEQ